MKCWYFKSINSETLTFFSFYVTILECNAPLNLKMPRNRKRECPACFNSVNSDVLKTHCKIDMKRVTIRSIRRKTIFENIKRNILVELSIIVIINCTVIQENLMM